MIDFLLHPVRSPQSLVFKNNIGKQVQKILNLNIALVQAVASAQATLTSSLFIDKKLGYAFNYKVQIKSNL